MKYKRGLIVLVFIIILRFVFMEAIFSINNRGEKLYGEKGILNISQEEGLSGTKTYQIEGEWEILDSGDIDSESYIDNNFKGLNFGEKYKSYRLKIICASKNNYLLMLPNSTSVNKLWINGASIEYDKESIADYNHGYKTQIIQIDKDMYYFEDNKYVLDIELEIITDNVYRNKAYNVILGKPEAVRKDYDISVFLNTFASGVYFIILIYSLSLYVKTKREKYLIYLALIALVSLLKSIINSPSVAVTDFLGLHYYYLRRLDIITGVANTFLEIMLCYVLYPRELSKSTFKIIVWFSLIILSSLTFISYDLTVFISKLYFISIYWVVSVVNILIYIRAYVHKREGVFALIVGSSLYGSTAMFEIMVSAGYAQLGFLNRYLNTAQYGCLIFTIMVSIIISLRYAGRFNEAGEISVVLDYTNKNLKSIVEEQTKELNDTNEKLKDAYNELLEFQRTKQAMILNLSHDLRTPISVIKGYIDVLKEGLVDDEQTRDRYLNRIYAKADYLSKMISDLFLLAKLEENKLTFNKSLVDINTVLQQIAGDMKIKAVEKDIKIHIETCSFPIVEEVDKFRLCQVLENIIMNAIKYVERGGKIVIGATMVNEGKVRIYVKDNGCGIEEKELPNIFNRYFRSKKNNSVDESTGLGLCIAREIVEKHGGSIWAESEFSKGTTIFIML